MKLSIVFLSLSLFWWGSCHSRSVARHRNGIDVELIENGTSYKITSMFDGSVITVLPGGHVITDIWTGREEQKWTLIEHPLDPRCLEFVQVVVPYNDLSGYEDPEDNPGTFPRPLTLNNHRIMPDLKPNASDSEYVPVPWQILIRNRWCLQSNGLGRDLDIDDCEWQPAPWQFWVLEVVQLGST